MSEKERDYISERERDIRKRRKIKRRITARDWMWMHWENHRCTSSITSRNVCSRSLSSRSPPSDAPPDDDDDDAH